MGGWECWYVQCVAFCNVFSHLSSSVKSHTCSCYILRATLCTTWMHEKGGERFSIWFNLASCRFLELRRKLKYQETRAIQDYYFLSVFKILFICCCCLCILSQSCPCASGRVVGPWRSFLARTWVTSSGPQCHTHLGQEVPTRTQWESESRILSMHLYWLLAPIPYCLYKVTIYV